MEPEKEPGKLPNFSGYATKYNVLCNDGLTIRHGAFKSNNGLTVPLMWQHMHDDPKNVIGHAILEHRADGDYARCYLNDTEYGKLAKQVIEHGDVKSLSIWANRLVKQGTDVLHGVIREVSLCVTGMNPGAFIDWVSFQHGDTTTESDSEAIIYTGLEFTLGDRVEHSDTPAIGETVQHAQADSTKEEPVATDTDTDKTKTIQDVLDSFTEEQRDVMEYILGELVSDDADDDTDDTVQQSDTDDADSIKHADTNKEGTDSLMHNNVFEGTTEEKKSHVLSHADVEKIFTAARRGGSLKEAVLAHAGTYGIDDIDRLFPDPKATTDEPEFISRRMEWVSDVLTGVKKLPFANVKSIFADITPDEARAKGYVTGSLKKEEVFGLLKRSTTPTTLYKKQKLDRDDKLDITDFDVVRWLKNEMRIMLDEEAARAILIGDGRDALHADKIKDPAGATAGAGIRSIYNDHDLYAHNVTLPHAAGATAEAKAKAAIEGVIRARKFYKGSGAPSFYTTADEVTEMLLVKNGNGDYMYKTVEELATKLRVARIVEVEVMEGTTRTVATQPRQLVGIIVNLRDYATGTNRGGEITLFDDFDIDYNQEKYLLETRFSGGLIKPKSALVIERATA